MADDRKLFSIAEEGCLRVSSHIRQVVLSQIPQRLARLLLKRPKGNRNQSSFRHRVEDSLVSPSTTGLESQGGDEGGTSASLKSSSANKPRDPFICISVVEIGTLIVAQIGLLGVRKDFGLAILCESILRPNVISEDDIVNVELPHNEVG